MIYKQDHLVTQKFGSWFKCLLRHQKVSKLLRTRCSLAVLQLVI